MLWPHDPVDTRCLEHRDRVILPEHQTPTPLLSQDSDVPMASLAAG